MKSYEPFYYTVAFKPHQVITPGETILETTAGQKTRLKVLEIVSVIGTVPGITLVQMKVRELPGIFGR